MSLTGITLASVFFDLVEESTFSGLLATNDFPERDSIGADSSGAFQLDVLCTNGNNVDLTATDIYVEGVQAYDGGTASWINSFTGSTERLPVSGPLLTDWRMELAGVTSWTAGNGATNTKVDGSPDGYGIQVLQVAFNALADPNANQAAIVTNTETYRVQGKARGDGTAVPRILFGAVVVWTGTNSATWQSFDFIVTSTVTGLMALESQIAVAGYTQWDNVDIKKLGPDYRLVGQAPAAWTSEQVITVRVVSADDGGPVDTLDFSYDFTVEDLVAPTILSVVARDHETLRVTFSEAMTATSATATKDALNPDSYTITFIPATDRQAAVWALVDTVAAVSTAVYDLTTDMPLTFTKTYRLAANVEDSSGNDISPIANTLDFTSWEPPGWAGVHCPDFYDYFSPDMQARDEGDLERLCSVLQDQWEYMTWDAYRFPADVFDHATAPEQEIDRMLVDHGNPFKFDIDADQKRRLLELLFGIYGLKGTEQGIRLLADFFTDVEITDVRPATEVSWIMGMSVLGIGTYLGPSLQRNLYSFEVLVNTALTTEQRNQLTQLINYIKVAHEHAAIVEPTGPTFIDHWTMGLSALGLNTWLHA